MNGLEKGTLTLVNPSDCLEDHLRCFPRLPIDSEIDWNLPAKKIEQLIRASSEPFSGAYTFLAYKKLIIWEAAVFEPEYNYLATPGQVVERRISKGEVVVSTGSDFLFFEKFIITFAEIYTMNSNNKSSGGRQARKGNTITVERQHKS